MMRALELRVADAARRTAFGVAGITLLSVGTAFLTVACWVLLVRVADVLTAAFVIGAVYLGTGLICLGFAAARRRRPAMAARPAPTPPPPPQAPGWDGLVQAFLKGLDTGMRAGVNTGARPRAEEPPRTQP